MYIVMYLYPAGILLWGSLRLSTAATAAVAATRRFGPSSGQRLPKNNLDLLKTSNLKSLVQKQ